MKRLKTSLCGLFDIEVPILQAGTGGIAYGKLAAAISNAGALGCIAAIDGTPGHVEMEIQLFRKLSSKPLCVDLGVAIGPCQDQTKSLEDAKLKLDIALSYGAEAIACALGTPKWLVDNCHARGTKVIGIVSQARHVRKVVEAGADAVVVQGTRGRGHPDGVDLITLLAEALPLAPIPVIAAGGIVHGAQIAGVLTQGAQGVWVGTRFLSSHESANAGNGMAAVLEAERAETILRRLVEETVDALEDARDRILVSA